MSESLFGGQVVPNPASTVPGLRLVDGNDISQLVESANAAQDGFSFYVPQAGAVNYLTTPGAIPRTTNIYGLKTGTAGAFTVAAPPAGTTAQASFPVTLVIIGLDAEAYTVTFPTGKLASGAAGQTTATFSGHVGASLTVQSLSLNNSLPAYADAWFVLAANGITFS